MQRWRGLDHLPGGWGRCVVTIGVFDGVHKGHQALIGRAVALAKQRGLPSVLMTFDPHPSEVVRPGSHPAQLTTLRRRAELVEELGIDHFVVVPFSLETSRMPADEFVHEVLVEKLHAAAVVVGQNFTFGHKAAGNVALLRQLGQRFGFVTEGADLVSADEVTYSSTYVRACIDAGDVRAAAEALGGRTGWRASSSRATAAARTWGSRPPTCRRPSSRLFRLTAFTRAGSRTRPVRSSRPR